MGFRSSFITEEIYIEVPQWFVEKYPNHYIHTYQDGTRNFPVIQPWESKFYADLEKTEIFQDMQRILEEDTRFNDRTIVLILLHECGGITRVTITKDSITGREPTAWKEVIGVEHNYCYGCSDRSEDYPANNTQV